MPNYLKDIIKSELVPVVAEEHESDLCHDKHNDGPQVCLYQKLNSAFHGASYNNRRKRATPHGCLALQSFLRGARKSHQRS